MGYIIGIDPSINSTGICIKNDNDYIYYNIVSKMTKKMKNFKHDKINIIDYHKETNAYSEYELKESQKTHNIYNICKIIDELVLKFKPDRIFMEGISYGSVGSAALVDLAGLNYAIRITIEKYNIPITIISPTSVKKFAVSNGQAEKNIIIDAWKRLDKSISNVNDIKIDDLADSFFIANYQS